MIRLVDEWYFPLSLIWEVYISTAVAPMFAWYNIQAAWWCRVTFWGPTIDLSPTSSHCKNIPGTSADDIIWNQSLHSIDRLNWLFLLWPMSHLLIWKGGVSPLHCTQPPGGDQDKLASHSGSSHLVHPVHGWKPTEALLFLPKSKSPTGQEWQVMNIDYWYWFIWAHSSDAATVLQHVIRTETVISVIDVR